MHSAKNPEAPNLSNGTIDDPLPRVPAQQVKSEPVPKVPPKQQQNRAGLKIIAVVSVVLILIIAALLIGFGGDENENTKNGDDNGHNDNGDNGGNGDKDVIKYTTALGGKSQADSAALAWDASAALAHVRGFEGAAYRIDRDEWAWVSVYKIPTDKDETAGDGKCIAWEYEYFPATGDLYNRLHVLVFGNGTVIQWEANLTGAATSSTLAGWDLDSTGATEIAKTLELYNNITSSNSNRKYTYYELWPNYWEITTDDGSDYIRIQIDETKDEMIYHYP